MRRRRMDERDERVVGARSRFGVNETDASGLELLERGANVLDAQRDVMETRGRASRCTSRSPNPARSPRAAPAWAANGNVTRADALREHLFRRFDLETERVPVERERGLDVLHGDADVIEHRLHAPSARLMRLAAAE